MDSCYQGSKIVWAFAMLRAVCASGKDLDVEALGAQSVKN